MFEQGCVIEALEGSMWWLQQLCVIALALRLCHSQKAATKGSVILARQTVDKSPMILSFPT